MIFIYFVIVLYTTNTQFEPIVRSRWAQGKVLDDAEKGLKPEKLTASVHGK